MVQRVQVGNDTLEFPDEMSDTDIEAAINKEYPQAGGSGNSPQQQASQAAANPEQDPSGWKPDTSPAHSKAIQDAYDAMPWYAKAGTAAGDLGRLAAHGFTGGLNNRFIGDVAGAFTGDYDTAYRARQQADADARIRAPVAGAAADALGFMVGPGKIMPAERAIQSVPALMGEGVMPFLGRTLSRIGLGGGENVAANAVANVGNKQDPGENSLEAAGAGAFGSSVLGPALTTVAGAAGNTIPGMTIMHDPVPTAPPRNYTGPPMDTLQSRKNAAYDVVGQHAPYAAADIRPAVQDMRTQLTNMRLNPKIHPGSDARLTDLEDTVNPNSNVNWATGSKNPNPIDLAQEQQFIREDTKNPNSTRDATLGNVMVNRLQDVLDNTRTTAGVLAGPDLEQARLANARYKNSAMLDAWHAEDVNNPKSSAVLPNNARAVLKDKDQMVMMRPQDQTALEGIARGGPFARFADFVAGHPMIGPMATGLTTGLLTGSTGTGLAGALAYPVASMGARAVSKYSSNVAMNAARRTMTDTPNNFTPFSDAANSGLSRDRLNALMAGFYNQ